MTVHTRIFVSYPIHILLIHTIARLHTTGMQIQYHLNPSFGETSWEKQSMQFLTEWVHWCLCTTCDACLCICAHRLISRAKGQWIATGCVVSVKERMPRGADPNAWAHTVGDCKTYQTSLAGITETESDYTLLIWKCGPVTESPGDSDNWLQCAVCFSLALFCVLEA